MSFHRSAEDVARINATLNNKRLSGERIEVAFRSDPDVIASVLPDPLKPSGSDRVIARVTRWITNYCGAFTMAALYVDSTHDGLDGEYMLSMFIDSYDAAMLVGREAQGEPKKMASIDLFRSHTSFVGTVERYGTRLMTLNVDAGEDVGPSEGNHGRVIYSIKATLALGGGIEDDALLLASTMNVKTSESRPGSGRIELGGTAHDPLDEFPVLEVLGASYATQELNGSRPAVGDSFIRAVIPADEFLPYHYGRLDDWSAHNAFQDLAVPLGTS